MRDKELNGDIKGEIKSSFKEEGAGMDNPISFIDLSKDMLKLEPQRLECYVCEILMESLLCLIERNKENEIK